MRRASAHGLIEPPTSTPTSPVTDQPTFEPVLQSWRPLAHALDHLASSVGSTPIYPIHPSGAVVDKLEFVHALIRDQVERGRGDDEPVALQYVETGTRSNNEEST